MRTIVCLALSAWLAICAGSQAAVLEVGPDKSYRTISEGASAASPGDTLLVYPGIYAEADLFLKEGTTLAGTGRDKTIIAYDGAMSTGNILSCSDGTVIRGCWLIGAPTYPVRGFRECAFELRNCVIWGNARALAAHYPESRVVFTNCTVFGNEEGIVCENGSSVELRNTVVYGNTSNVAGDVANISATNCNIEGGWPGEGNIDADPLFVNPQELDYCEVVSAPSSGALTTNLRLKPASPCIDAGFNDPELPETDIAGMHRIMYGGKSRTVDMGAYEYYINELEPGPGAEEATLTWSSLGDRSYSILYSEDLLTWHLAIESFPSAGYQTTSWIDDGSKTGVRPWLAPRRFYRILENP